MSRRVDRAMSANRPEKTAIRRLWLAQVRKYDAELAGKPPELLLFTLAGAEGRDIQYLIDNRVLAVTEVGSLHPDSQGKVVAIENSRHAVADLQRRMPGLKIIFGAVQDVVHGSSPVRYPQGGHEEACRAR